MFGSCVINFPPSVGEYCLKGGFYVNTGSTNNGGLIIQGGGVQGTRLSVCGANVILARTNNQWVSIRDMTMYGYGSFPTDAVFTGSPPVAPTVQCDQSTVTGTSTFFNMRNVYVTGGTAGIELQCNNYVIDQVETYGSYGDGVHIFAPFWAINGGGTVRDTHFDMGYPVSQPLHGAALPSAWAGAHAYAKGDIVQVTCNTRGWWVQAENAGTSGGAFPGCPNFGYTTWASDNVTGSCPNPSVGVCWRLVNFTSSNCAQLDTGSIEVWFVDVDLTCDANYGLALTNTFGANPPSQIHLIHTTPGGTMSGAYDFQAGSHVTMVGAEVNNCIVPGCIGVYMHGSFAGPLTSTALSVLGNVGYCVAINAGTNVGIFNSTCTSSDTVGIIAGTNVSNFNISNNIFANTIGNAITVSAGTSNRYVIGGNLCNGAGFTDGGSGVNKIVQASCP
jgi:hypothetical protein